MQPRADQPRVARLASLAIAAVALIIGGALGVQLSLANASYQQATALHLQQSLLLSASEAQLAAAVDAADSDLDVAAAALVATPAGYVSGESIAALTDTSTALAGAIARAEDVVAPELETETPAFEAAALSAASSTLRDDALRAEDSVGAQALALAALEEADSANRAAGTELLASANAFAASVLPNNPSVGNQPHIGFLRMLDELTAQDTLDEDSVNVLIDYVAWTNDVRASHAAEEAEKSGPLYGTRVQIEAYARSISGGVFLEFNWQPLVIGYGDGGSMAGTATIEGVEPYLSSTITLTNSIAEYWGGTVPLSLVTHEVGHAITSKCWDLFDASFNGDYEQWATAWAMSWGFPAGASGADRYGVPTPEQVAIAGTCR